MALKTEDDYQDEIDDLMKEIDRLYDEGTDKGFNLKREEEMEQEKRALETDFETRKNSIIANLTDLEARKNEVLDGLELRALETEADFEKALRKIDNERAKNKDYIGKLEADKRKYEKQRNALQMELNEVETLLKNARAEDVALEKEFNKMEQKAKKKGFHIHI